MEDLILDKIEKTLTLIEYYINQAKVRKDEFYFQQAADYCQDILVLEDIGNKVYQRTYFLRTFCYLQLAKGKAIEIKQNYFNQILLDYRQLLCRLDLVARLFADTDKVIMSEFMLWYDNQVNETKRVTYVCEASDVTRG